MQKPCRRVAPRSTSAPARSAAAIGFDERHVQFDKVQDVRSLAHPSADRCARER
jgi:hypothetical protein